MAAILSAIISGVVTLVVCLINNNYQRKRDEKSRKDTKKKEQADITERLEEIKDAQNEFKTQIHNEIEMVKYQLSELTKHVDKHNNVIERTYELEKQTEIQEEKIRVANHRIEDLEKAVNR